MRKFFVPLAKLAGLLILYWSLESFMQIMVLVGMLTWEQPGQVKQIVPGLVGVGLYFLLSLILSWLLLARTAWLADRFGIQDEGQLPSLPERALLLVGMKLIGLHVLVIAIPALVRALFDAHGLWKGEMTISNWSRIIPATLQVALGLCLVLKTERVAALIGNRNEETTPADSPDPDAAAETPPG